MCLSFSMFYILPTLALIPELQVSHFVPENCWGKWLQVRAELWWDNHIVYVWRQLPASCEVGDVTEFSINHTFSPAAHQVAALSRPQLQTDQGPRAQTGPDVVSLRVSFLTCIDTSLLDFQAECSSSPPRHACHRWVGVQKKVTSNRPDSNRGLPAQGQPSCQWIQPRSAPARSNLSCSWW